MKFDLKYAVYRSAPFLLLTVMFALLAGMHFSAMIQMICAVAMIVIIFPAIIVFEKKYPAYKRVEYRKLPYFLLMAIFALGLVGLVAENYPNRHDGAAIWFLYFTLFNFFSGGLAFPKKKPNQIKR
jgi:phosphatidylglycerophosphate synthase